MRVLDPGHEYGLRSLDGTDSDIVTLTFVKREGPGYPGNVGSHSGTTTQEVLRALIERTQYVDGQIHDEANDQVLHHLRMTIWHLEERAARRHGRYWLVGPQEIEKLATCEKCNHIGCDGDCH